MAYATSEQWHEHWLAHNPDGNVQYGSTARPRLFIGAVIRKASRRVDADQPVTGRSCYLNSVRGPEGVAWR